MPPERPSPRPDDGSRGRLVALVGVVILVGVLFLVGQAVVRHNALQNCLDSGRRDCDTRLQTP